MLRALLPPDPEQAEKPPAPLIVGRAVVVEQTGPASIQVQSTWRIRADRPGWLELPLPDPSFWADGATWRGRPIPVRGMRNGSRRLLVRVDRDGELSLTGELPGELRRGIRLSLPAATSGTVRVITDDPVIEVAGDGRPAIEAEGRLWTGAAEVTVSTERALEREPTPPSDLVVASSGLGLTVGDGAIEAQGRLRWEVRRGSVSSVRFSVPEAQDLKITGARVARWTRQGGAVTVELTEPSATSVELEATWSMGLPEGDEATLPTPQLVPLDVFRANQALQFARDGDRELVPEMPGWVAIPQRDLPQIAEGLVKGTPISTWTANATAPSTLRLFRFEPVSGPPTIIDVAAWEGALSREGRVLMRGHLAVRNDRGAFLEVTLPPKTRLVSVRVDGLPARVAKRGERYLVPLAKSLETVEGLLSFPITLVLLGDAQAFGKKDVRELTLPQLSAEVAVTRTSLHMPPGYRSRLKEGEHGTVGDFDRGEGLTYGFVAGDGKIAEADALYRDALNSWMANDFESTEGALDDLRALGGDNENVQRLQSNLDVVSGKRDDNGAFANRVKDQARARSSVQKAEQEVLMKEADNAYASGDYDKAEKAYGSAMRIGQTLQKLETGGAVEEQSANEFISDKLSKSSSAKKKKKAKGAAGRAYAQEANAPAEVVITEDRIVIFENDETVTLDANDSDMDGDPAPRYKKRTEIDFEGLDVTGELTKPQGALVFDRPKSGEMQITATTHDVVIPARGETVRYQRLLTPADALLALTVEVEEKKR